MIALLLHTPLLLAQEAVLPAERTDLLWIVPATVAGRSGRFVVGVESACSLREGFAPAGVYEGEAGGSPLERTAYRAIPDETLALLGADGVLGGEALKGRIVGFGPREVRIWPGAGAAEAARWVDGVSLGGSLINGRYPAVRASGFRFAIASASSQGYVRSTVAEATGYTEIALTKAPQRADGYAPYGLLGPLRFDAGAELSAVSAERVGEEKLARYGPEADGTIGLPNSGIRRVAASLATGEVWISQDPDEPLERYSEVFRGPRFRGEGDDLILASLPPNATERMRASDRWRVLEIEGRDAREVSREIRAGGEAAFRETLRIALAVNRGLTLLLTDGTDKVVVNVGGG